MLSTVEAAVLATLLAGASVVMESHHRIDTTLSDTTLSDDEAARVSLTSTCQPAQRSERMMTMVSEAMAGEQAPALAFAPSNDSSDPCAEK